MLEFGSVENTNHYSLKYVKAHCNLVPEMVAGFVCAGGGFGMDGVETRFLFWLYNWYI